MIVWGGRRRALDLLQHGGSLRPSDRHLDGDHARAGAPTARDGHKAVWTGSRMIVWGGGERDGPYKAGRSTTRRRTPGRRPAPSVRRPRRELAHGRVDGLEDDRLGRADDAVKPRHGRDLRPDDGHLDGDDHRRELRPHLAHGRLDGLEDDRLGWAVQGRHQHRRAVEHGRDLRPCSRPMDGDDHGGGAESSCLPHRHLDRVEDGRLGRRSLHEQPEPRHRGDIRQPGLAAAADRLLHR